MRKGRGKGGGGVYDSFILLGGRGVLMTVLYRKRKGPRFANQSER